MKNTRVNAVYPRNENGHVVIGDAVMDFTGGTTVPGTGRLNDKGAINEAFRLMAIRCLETGRKLSPHMRSANMFVETIYKRGFDKDRQVVRWVGYMRGEQTVTLDDWVIVPKHKSGIFVTSYCTSSNLLFVNHDGSRSRSFTQVNSYKRDQLIGTRFSNGLDAHHYALGYRIEDLEWLKGFQVDNNTVKIIDAIVSKMKEAISKGMVYSLDVQGGLEKYAVMVRKEDDLPIKLVKGKNGKTLSDLCQGRYGELR